jgi:hypothetical protein
VLIRVVIGKSRIAKRTFDYKNIMHVGKLSTTGRVIIEIGGIQQRRNAESICVGLF